jgi:hypothetical protein
MFLISESLQLWMADSDQEIMQIYVFDVGEIPETKSN